MSQYKGDTRILLIQTAFIGDAILATALLESIANAYQTKVDILVRKGNGIFFENNPNVGQLLIWDKKGSSGKYKSLLKLIKTVKGNRYHTIINLQRFAATGLLTALSGAKQKVGFTQNPLSAFYTHKIKHRIAENFHEVDRNFELLSLINKEAKNLAPKLYIDQNTSNSIQQYQSDKYICIFPGSVWFTKRLGTDKWVELINQIPENIKVFFLGAPDDNSLAQEIMEQVQHKNCQNLCGQLNLLQSAALGKDALINYCNDSAPVHFLSAVNARVETFFLSTSPIFGFYPISEQAKVRQATNLNCKPCGMVGKKECPEGHFRCNLEVDTKLNL